MCGDMEEDCPSHPSYGSDSFGSNLQPAASKDTELQSIREDGYLKHSPDSNENVSGSRRSSQTNFSSGKSQSHDNGHNAKPMECLSRSIQIEKGSFENLGPKEISQMSEKIDSDRIDTLNSRDASVVHQNFSNTENRSPSFFPKSVSSKTQSDIETDCAQLSIRKCPLFDSSCDSELHTKSTLKSRDYSQVFNKNHSQLISDSSRANLNKNTIPARSRTGETTATTVDQGETIVLRVCNSGNDNEQTKVLTPTSDISTCSLRNANDSRTSNRTTSSPEPRETKTDNAHVTVRNSPETEVLVPFGTGSVTNLNLNRISKSYIRNTNENSVATTRINSIQSPDISPDYTRLMKCFEIEWVFAPNGDGDSQVALGIINFQTDFVMEVLTRVTEQSILDIPNKDGNTILHLATITKQHTVVRRLIVLGANVTAQNTNGNTALHIASMYGFFNCVKALTEPIQPPEVKHRRYYTPYQRIPQRQDILNYDGFSCLHLACKFNNVNIIDHLLYDGGANVNIQDGTSGMTILHYAAIENNFALVRYLLTIRALDLNAMRYDNVTPLALARGRNNLSVMELLQENGAIDIDNDDVIDDIDDVMYEYTTDEDGDCVMVSEISRKFDEMNLRKNGSGVFYDDVQINGNFVG